MRLARFSGAFGEGSRVVWISWSCGSVAWAAVVEFGRSSRAMSERSSAKLLTLVPLVEVEEDTADLLLRNSWSRPDKDLPSRDQRS
jgi:hypothetical protein